MASLWCELLGLDGIGIDDSFFDLGGTSIAAIRMVNLYHQRFDREIPAAKVFQYPTIARLCWHLEDGGTGASLTHDVERRVSAQHRSHPIPDLPRDGVAVIGMVGRFPGADTLDKLWENLRATPWSRSHILSSRMN